MCMRVCTCVCVRSCDKQAVEWIKRIGAYADVCANVVVLPPERFQKRNMFHFPRRSGSDSKTIMRRARIARVHAVSKFENRF